MGWSTKKGCPNCGRKNLEETDARCPTCKTKLFDLEPEISNRIKRVTLWIALYGWAQCVYWVLDTLVFWGSNQQETSFALNGWLYSFTRLGIGVVLIYFAKKAKKHPDKVASYLFYTMWVLSVKLILMMCFDALFYHYHINQALNLQNSGATVCGIGILITLFKYVVNQKKAIRELKQQIDKPLQPCAPTSRTVKMNAKMTTEERLENLERGLNIAKRRNFWLLGGCALLILCCLTLAAIRGNSRVIRAKQFILEDANGKTRAKLGLNEDGPELVLMDANGKDRAALSAFEGIGPELVLRGTNSLAFLVLSAHERTGAALYLMDAKGEARAALSAFEGVGPELSLCDANGKERATMSVMDEPELALRDANGKARAELGVKEEGPGLVLRGENEETSVSLGENEDGPGLFLMDANGKVRSALDVNKDGRPLLSLWDANTKCIWKTP